MSALDTARPAGAALLHLIASIVLAGIAAALGTVASVDAAGFYARLDQPGLAPPAWLFGPVWSLLYLMMALAAWRIAGIATPRAAPALLLYLA
jgi:tryptophan-rich sensory protein